MLVEDADLGSRVTNELDYGSLLVRTLILSRDVDVDLTSVQLVNAFLADSLVLRTTFLARTVISH